MTLRPGLLALVDAPLVGARWFEGLADTAGALAEAFGKRAPAALASLLHRVQAACEAPPANVPAVRARLDEIGIETERVVASPEAVVAGEEPAFWAAALARQCSRMREELALLAPPGASAIPTLRAVAARDEPAAGDDTRTRARARIAEIERLAALCTEL